MKLYAIRYSPWSIQARWALEHHQLEYEYIEHLPMLGVPGLRIASKNFRTITTVPTLVDGDSVFADSWMIARHADKNGDGPKLFSGQSGEIRRWNEVGETIKHWGRVHATRVVERDRAALAESLPDFIPGPLRTISIPVAKMGAHYLTRKYGYSGETLLTARDHMRRALLEIRRGLKDGQFLDDFSYADICTATSLGFIKPHGSVPLGPASRRAFTIDELASEFADLVEWRDDLYAAHLPERLA